MSATQRLAVRKRANARCENCQLPDLLPNLMRSHLEHIRAQRHGGSTSPANLAWACARCNERKGKNLSGVIKVKGSVPQFDTEIALVEASCISRQSRTEAPEEVPLDGIYLFTRKKGFLRPISELGALTRYRKNLRTILRGGAIASGDSSC